MPPTAALEIGVLCALPEELGRLAGTVTGRRVVCGLALLEAELAGRPALLCVGGVGKVRAARAAALLLREGVRALLVVGVCGALRRAQRPGDLVHCARAVQADLAVRADREATPDAALLAAWQHAAPGRLGWFVTADRPALTPWRRLRLLRAFASGAAVDMETAAAAAVAAAAGVPWAALRAVSDGLLGGPLQFRRNFPSVAGAAADTIPELLARLADTSRLPGGSGPAESG